MGNILILGQERQKMVIPGTDLRKPPLRKGTRVFDLMKTPSGHVALEVDGSGPQRRMKAQCRLLPRPILTAKMPRYLSRRQLAHNQLQGNLHRA
eukprot:2034471-Pyramimonas_sp.AAC.1